MMLIAQMAMLVSHLRDDMRLQKTAQRWRNCLCTLCADNLIACALHRWHSRAHHRCNACLLAGLIAHALMDSMRKQKQMADGGAGGGDGLIGWWSRWLEIGDWLLSACLRCYERYFCFWLSSCCCWCFSNKKAEKQSRKAEMKEMFCFFAFHFYLLPCLTTCVQRLLLCLCV